MTWRKPESGGASTGWLDCADAEAWREWLSSHHDRNRDVWLRIYKKRAAGQGITLEAAVTEALCYGWIDSQMQTIDADSYILHFTPRQPDSLWSMNNRQRAEALLAAGRMTAAGLATIEAAQVNGRWEQAYSSRVKPAVPSDLLAELQLDPRGYDNFCGWANSIQLQYIVWIEQAKRPETRRQRIAAVVRRAMGERT